MAEWLKATDCKSVHVSVRRFEPYSAHTVNIKIGYCGSCSMLHFNSSLIEDENDLISKLSRFQIFK